MTPVMKFLFWLAIAAAAVYGVYWWFENQSGGAATRFAQEAAGGQVERSREMVGSVRQKMAGAAAQEVARAVAQFREQNGRNPSGLQELVDRGFMQSVPPGLTYDPATGEVGAAQ